MVVRIFSWGKWDLSSLMLGGAERCKCVAKEVEINDLVNSEQLANVCPISALLTATPVLGIPKEQPPSTAPFTVVTHLREDQTPGRSGHVQ